MPFALFHRFSHTHTQLLSVSMCFACIVKNSRPVDAWPVSAPIPHVSWRSFQPVRVTVVSVLAALGEESHSTESTMKEKMKSFQTSSHSALLYFYSPQSRRRRRRVEGWATTAKFAWSSRESGKKKGRRSIHYQVMEGDEREGVKWQIEIRNTHI